MEFGQFWRENRWARDAVAPTLILILTLLTAGGPAYFGFGGGRTALLLSVMLTVPLFWRRRHPELVFGITAFLALSQVVLGAGPLIGDLAVPLVVHAVTAYVRDRIWGWAALGTGLFGSIIGPYVWFRWDATWSGLVVIVAVAAMSIGVAFLIGRREVTHRDESQAAGAERERLLAIERDQRVEMAAAAERTRIARELHDIVAHSLSVVVVQADGGRAAAKTKPEVAQEVLDTIAETARTALMDMRRLVGVLRSGAGAEDDHPDFAPAPTAADVPELVDQVRRAGRTVDLVVAGDERELPAGVGLAAYRVVQESLTNIIKHAGPQAKAEVALNYGPAELSITVIDDGRGSAAFHDGLGNGLTGMRERVALQGGTVAAHPRAGGGFLVTATLPAPPSGAGSDRGAAGTRVGRPEGDR